MSWLDYLSEQKVFSDPKAALDFVKGFLNSENQDLKISDLVATLENVFVTPTPISNNAEISVVGGGSEVPATPAADPAAHAAIGATPTGSEVPATPADPSTGSEVPAAPAADPTAPADSSTGSEVPAAPAADPAAHAAIGATPTGSEVPAAPAPENVANLQIILEFLTIKDPNQTAGALVKDITEHLQNLQS